jgi:hypothetical protein
VPRARHAALRSHATRVLLQRRLWVRRIVDLVAELVHPTATVAATAFTAAQHASDDASTKPTPSRAAGAFATASDATSAIATSTLEASSLAPSTLPSATVAASSRTAAAHPAASVRRDGGRVPHKRPGKHCLHGRGDWPRGRALL